MAKMIKKKQRMRIASLSKGIELIRAETIILSPSIPEIVRKGLKTLNDLSAERSAPPMLRYSRNPEFTITKSSKFQESLR